MTTEENNVVTIKMLIDSDMQRQISNKAEKETIAYIRETVQKRIFQKRYSYWGARGVDENNDPLQDWVCEEVKKLLEDNKEEIIRQAAKNLAYRMTKSKTVREKFPEYVQEELDL